MTIRARIVLGLGMLGVLTAACEPSPASIDVGTRPSSFTAAAAFAQTPLHLTPLFGTRCAFGSAFGMSFHLVITTGAHDLTMDSLTLELLDGTHLGGPSVTIPSLEMAPQRSLLFIPAATTRDFAVRASFGCVAGRPRSIRGNVFLFDRFGSRHTMAVEGRVL